MIESGPQMIVDGPSITKMRLKMIAFGCEMIICKTDKIVSAPANNYFRRGDNYFVRRVRNSLIRGDLMFDGNNRFCYGNNYLHLGNSYL